MPRRSPIGNIPAALILAVSAIGLLAACSRVPTYHINLSPTWKVGQKFLYVSDATSDTSQTVARPAGSPALPGDQVENHVRAHLEAQGETLAVFPNGSVHQMALTLQVLNATNDGGTVTGLPSAGAKIVAERDEYGEESFTVDGQEPSPDVTSLLRMLVVPGDPKHTDQYNLGPPGPVAVGEEWDINRTAFLEQHDKFLNAQSATGKMKLISVSGSGAGQVAEVQGQYVVSDMQLPPQMFTSGTGELTGEYSGTIPALAQGPMKQEFTQNMKITGQGTDDGTGAKVQITLSSASHVAQQTTFQ